MRPKIRSLYLFLLVVVIVSQNPLLSESMDKIILQKDTAELMDRLDQFSGRFKNLIAIFSDQSKENIKEYGRQFCEITALLSELEKIQKKWEAKLLLKQLIPGVLQSLK